MRLVNHEFRSPMNVALSMIWLLQKKQSTPLEVSSGLELLRFSCEDALSVLDNFNALESGRNEMPLTSCLADVDDIIQNLVKQFESAALQSSIDLSLSLQPCDSSNFWFMIDVIQIKLALRNLLASSLKVTPPKGSVIISTLQTDDGARISFTSRRGVEPGIVAVKMAEELEAGMSLDAARLIVSLHRGSISVERDVSGLALIVHVDLPLTYISNTPTKLRGGGHRQSLVCDSFDKTWKPRVLIVDDDALCRKIHAKLFQASISESVEVMNGKEAVEAVSKSMLENRPFDLILMDSNMPIMTGPVASKFIREMGFTGAILGVTGNVLHADIEDFLLHGASEVLLKPLLPTVISRMINNISPRSTRYNVIV